MSFMPLADTSWVMTALLLALLALGCATPGAVTGSAGEPTVKDAEGAVANAGKTVRVSGAAHTAKLGPVVKVADLVVYCLDLAEWPDGTSGQSVTVRGTLEQTREFEAPDAHSTGTQGPVWVLRGCEQVP